MDLGYSLDFVGGNLDCFSKQRLAAKSYGKILKGVLDRVTEFIMPMRYTANGYEYS